MTFLSIYINAGNNLLEALKNVDNNLLQHLLNVQHTFGGTKKMPRMIIAALNKILILFCNIWVGTSVKKNHLLQVSYLCANTLP